jgi:anti-sigma28 factor (negative regulator of flagellin synthesis)
VKISNAQIEAILTAKGQVTPSAEVVDSAVIRLVDKELVDYTTRQVLAMADREDMILDLKTRIEAGEYKVDGQDVADAMIRRAIADRIN